MSESEKAGNDVGGIRGRIPSPANLMDLIAILEKQVKRGIKAAAEIVVCRKELADMNSPEFTARLEKSLAKTKLAMERMQAHVDAAKLAEENRKLADSTV